MRATFRHSSAPRSSRRLSIFPSRPDLKAATRSFRRRRKKSNRAWTWSIACLRSARGMARIIAAVTPFVSPIVPSSFFGGTASSIRAMPSARALLVASLLTEPPYGCLGPPGDDRYRKHSLRSPTAGFASQLPTSRRLVAIPPTDVFGHDPSQ
jgi:hypothetical protein